tara:strand:- start:133 stop:891 length:759 start_codon:yes stop_codon:yes gene_type:complete
MANKISETTTHNFDAVNQFIDEKARFKRTKSAWGYAKVFTLCILALGIFLILAAYAYHLFKKPHSLEAEFDQQQSEYMNKEIINKNNRIKQLEGNISQLEGNIAKLKEDVKNNPENQQLKQQIEQKTKEVETAKQVAEKTRKEKEEIEKKFNEQTQKMIDGKLYKYNQTTFQFVSSPLIDNKYFVNTRREYATTKDLLDQTGNFKESCYLTDAIVDYEFDLGSQETRSQALKVMGLTENQARGYEKYCERIK